MKDDGAEVFDLFDIYGQRKYLTTGEARRFVAVARKLARTIHEASAPGSCEHGLSVAG